MPPSSTTSTLHLLEQAALTLHPHRPNSPRIANTSETEVANRNANSGCTTIAIPDHRFPHLLTQAVSPERPVSLPPVPAQPVSPVAGQIDRPAWVVSTIGAAPVTPDINAPPGSPSAAADARVDHTPSAPFAPAPTPATATPSISSIRVGTSSRTEAEQSSASSDLRATTANISVQSHLDGAVTGLRENVLKLKADWDAMSEVVHAKRAEESALRAQADQVKREYNEAWEARERLSKQISAATGLYNEAKKFRDKATSFMEGAQE